MSSRVTYYGLAVLLTLLGSPFEAKTVSQWTLNSPDGRICVVVEMIGPTQQSAASDGRRRLYYRIEDRASGQRREVVGLSPLGINRNDQSFVDGLRFVSASPSIVIEDTYPLLHGKRSLCQARAWQRILTFSDGQQSQLHLVLRAYNDGIAFRYAFPETSPGTFTVTEEVTDLSPACQFKDTGWIKPGRVSWGWWSIPESPSKYEELRRFVDLAGEMGWEYSLVDAGWPALQQDGIPQLVRYAALHKVGILLWYNSGGHHNTVDGTPRDRMDQQNIRRREFQHLQEIGVRGIKVDFFQSDKQNLIQLYLDILRDAADFHLMVNFHGCTLPRGWERTYPHLMSMEAVRGAESYIFDSRYPKNAPWHNTILPFTRNVVGPMDYTPVAFTDNRHPHLTTNAHELALTVVFESAWLHFADRVSAYRELPDEPMRFLQKLPVAWDETRFLQGEPGKLVVLARRKGAEWYIGGINGEAEARQLQLRFPFLQKRKYQMLLITEGDNDRSFRSRTLKGFLAASPQLVPVRPRGGFVMHLIPEP